MTHGCHSFGHEWEVRDRGDREETVVLGVPAKVTVTLVVSVTPDTMPDVDVCRELSGEDEDPGR